MASPTAWEAASSAAADSGRRWGRAAAADLALVRSGDDENRRPPPPPKEDERPFAANAELRDRPGVMNRGRIGEGPMMTSGRAFPPGAERLRPSLRGGVDMVAELARLAGDRPLRGAGAPPSSDGNAWAAMAAASPAGPPGWLMEVRACSRKQ